MPRELVIELRQADFPFDWEQFDDHDMELLEKDWDIYKEVYSPSLEELIEACGADFQSLERVVRSLDGTLARTDHGEVGTQYWRARPTMMGSYTVRPHGGECATPNEAVARLWLALHKKV
jgi:hypothetical protein